MMSVVEAERHVPHPTFVRTTTHTQLQITPSHAPYFTPLSHNKVNIYFTISMCCFSGKHAAFSNNNVSEWSDISTCTMLFQFASTKTFQLGVLA
jgi:hypothetical protein